MKTLYVTHARRLILRPRQFCNLSEVVVRKRDTLSSLCDKVRSATILGTIQGTLTDFNVVGSEWKANCDEERLAWRIL